MVSHQNNKVSTVNYIIKSKILQSHQSCAALWLQNGNFTENIAAICDNIDIISSTRGPIKRRLSAILYSLVVVKDSKALSDIELGSVREALNEVYRQNTSKINIFSQSN